MSFVGNRAVEGGAIYAERLDQLSVSDATFTANTARLGGAVYIAGVNEHVTAFTSCIFEVNSAEDGGALYLYTNIGIDMITSSVFRGNVARKWSMLCLHVPIARVAAAHTQQGTNTRTSTNDFVNQYMLGPIHTPKPIVPNNIYIYHRIQTGWATPQSHAAKI